MVGEPKQFQLWKTKQYLSYGRSTQVVKKVVIGFYHVLFMNLYFIFGS